MDSPESQRLEQLFGPEEQIDAARRFADATRRLFDKLRSVTTNTIEGRLPDGNSVVVSSSDGEGRKYYVTVGTNEQPIDEENVQLRLSPYPKEIGVWMACPQLDGTRNTGLGLRLKKVWEFKEDKVDPNIWHNSEKWIKYFTGQVEAAFPKKTPQT